MVPRITAMQLPPMRVSTTVPPRFSADASRRLGRPISTPWAIRTRKRQVRLGAQAGEQPGERDIGAAGRRVLGHTVQRREHPRADVDPVGAVADIKMNAGRAVDRKARGEDVGTRPRRRQRLPRLQLGEDERRAAGGDARRMTPRLDVIDRERARRGDDVGGDIGPARQFLRRGEAGADDHATLLQHLDRHQPRLFLEQQRIADRVAIGAAISGDDKRGADIRMTGERHLGLRGEDAHLGGVRGVLRRQHKGRLRQVELVGDGLHLGRRQPLGLRQNRHRVAAKSAVGENIDGDELKLHGESPLGRS